MVAITDNFVGIDQEVEGPEQLVQAIITAKKSKQTTAHSSNAATTKNGQAGESTFSTFGINRAPVDSKAGTSKAETSKPSISQRAAGDFKPRRDGQTSRGNRGRGRRNFQQSDRTQPADQTETADQFEEGVDTRGNVRTQRNRQFKRGGFESRGRGEFRGRRLDRHSGMTKSNVKATESTHGRSDADWKQELSPTEAQTVESVSAQIDDMSLSQSGFTDGAESGDVAHQQSFERRGGFRGGRGRGRFSGRGRGGSRSGPRETDGSQQQEVTGSRFNREDRGGRGFRRGGFGAPRSNFGGRRDGAADGHFATEQKLKFNFDASDFPDFD